MVYVGQSVKVKVQKLMSDIFNYWSNLDPCTRYPFQLGGPRQC